jgi:hypothetical protein
MNEEYWQKSKMSTRQVQVFEPSHLGASFPHHLRDLMQVVVYGQEWKLQVRRNFNCPYEIIDSGNQGLAELPIETAKGKRLDFLIHTF